MNRLAIVPALLVTFLDNAGSRGIGQAVKRIAARTDAADTRDGVGFSSYDKGMGMYIAKWLRDNPEKEGPTGRYLGHAKRLAKKYAGQLADIYGADPSAFENDFGINVRLALRIAEVTESVKPKTTRVQLAEVDENGEVVKAYQYDGTEAEALLAGIQKFDRQLKTFRAGKLVGKPELSVMPEFLGLCATG
jgi:hypothetical protein